MNDQEYKDGLERNRLQLKRTMKHCGKMLKYVFMGCVVMLWLVVIYYTIKLLIVVMFGG